MDINIILKPAVLRIAGDDVLGNLLGEVRVVKGSKKPVNMVNPSFTVENRHIKVGPGEIYQGSFLITFYADNYKSGNADLELLGEVANRIKIIFTSSPFTLEGYKNYLLKVSNLGKAEYDNNFPDQHYIVVEVEYKVVKTA